MTDQVFTLKRGTAPLLISIPHAGTQIPDDIAATMNPIAREVDDTDWHLERLYGFAADMGASILAPFNSRYVIDLNRPPNGANLYPGRDTTGLCPVDTFNSEPLYPEGGAPTEAQIADRREKYWRPYHDALSEELARLKAAHGKVLLWEAHSIRSHVPRFFDGKLSDFNLGTAGGESAVAGVGEKLEAIVATNGVYTAVANGRFKGGYITRHFGKPQDGIHAVQLELSQITYMEESRPYRYDDVRARKVAQLIQDLMCCAMDTVREA
jgi:N-formylglutamate deformylase